MRLAPRRALSTNRHQINIGTSLDGQTAYYWWLRDVDGTPTNGSIIDSHRGSRHLAYGPLLLQHLARAIKGNLCLTVVDLVGEIDVAGGPSNSCARDLEDAAYRVHDLAERLDLPDTPERVRNGDFEVLLVNRPSTLHEGLVNQTARIAHSGLAAVVVCVESADPRSYGSRSLQAATAGLDANLLTLCPPDGGPRAYLRSDDDPIALDIYPRF